MEFDFATWMIFLMLGACVGAIIAIVKHLLK